MDRIAAYLLLKKLVRDPAVRRRARLAELLMERLAELVGQPRDQWAMMGLLLFVDQPYTLQNEEVEPGAIAREAAELDGLPPMLGTALERCWQPATEDSSALEDALRLAAHAAGRADGPVEPAQPAPQEQHQACLRLGITPQQLDALSAAARAALQVKP